ncbi:hypothetical protein NLJ89_g7203 [Agrocybe chaxingu]|uniref:NAD(P)-binding protein n=1 Tax=Agrocybe chaxingu TaxID=84603 RepID=A0A9W8MTX3_9AGAR|nr:hypothetical protein NLJ89_g7203 [Agrocybe chaxingu]
MSSPLVWLITGTLSGLGRDLALEALKRGDKVIATGCARSIDKLADLKAAGADILELDVTAPLEALHEVAKRAVAIHGSLNVLVNNAGYLIVGALEENTPDETFAEYNTKVFRALNVTRAFLPYMRARRSGTMILMGLVGGWIASPYTGLYVSTNVCLDYGYFRTHILAPDYTEVSKESESFLQGAEY